eukprot:1046976-Prorocentrum_lima.AAC.1
MASSEGEEDHCQTQAKRTPITKIVKLNLGGSGDPRFVGGLVCSEGGAQDGMQKLRMKGGSSLIHRG